jgi:hypothetical protein
MLVFGIYLLRLLRMYFPATRVGYYALSGRLWSGNWLREGMMAMYVVAFLAILAVLDEYRISINCRSGYGTPNLGKQLEMR